MARRRRVSRLNLFQGLEGLEQRLSEVADGRARQPVADAVAGKLYELTVNDATGHVYTGKMLETLDFYAEPGEVGVTIQYYKKFVEGLALRGGVPKKWRPELQQAGQEALRNFIGSSE